MAALMKCALDTIDIGGTVRGEIKRVHRFVYNNSKLIIITEILIKKERGKKSDKFFTQSVIFYNSELRKN